MKKTIAILPFIFWSILIYAQIPNGYYNSADGLTGTALKSALHNIVDGHTTYPYSSSSTDVWDILKEADKDPNNSSNVILFYTGWSVNAAQEYNSGSGWNREHVWAKSRGNFGTSQGAGTDAHHLRACDISVNSARNNRWFDEAPNEYLDSGVPTANYTSSTDWIWEPREAVKGDVARMLFYMVVRYEGTNGDPDLELVDYLPSSSTTDPVHAVLSTLLQWHLDDPVDSGEQTRNDVVYSYQNNRNPFIDHPEYVCEIWGGTCSDTTGSGSDTTSTGDTAITHIETFDNFNGSTSYASGSFTGVDGINWSYESSKNNPDITGQAVTLGKGKSPAGEVSTTAISNGIGTLKFDYMQPYSTTVNFEIYVNDSLIDNINSSTQNTVTSTPTYTLNLLNNCTIRIVQASSSAGQLTVDNIEWTDYISTGSGSGSTTAIESFSNCAPTTSTYSDGSFTGDNGNTWYYVQSRDELTYGIDGDGLMLRRASSNSKVYVDDLTGGISKIEFDLKKGFTGSGTRQVEVFINGNSVGTSVGFDNTTVQHIEIDNINVTGNFDLEITNITSKQVVIDNIEWTSYSAKSDATTSISIVDSKDISVYPNPFESEINIQMNANQEVQANIFDLNGRLIETQKLSQELSVINLSKLNSGIYILQLQGSVVHKTLRIQKM